MNNFFTELKRRNVYKVAVAYAVVKTIQPQPARRGEDHPPSPTLRRAGADNTDEEMIQEELSGEIIGAGMDVLNELRPGLDEETLRTRNDHRIEAPWPYSFDPKSISRFLSWRINWQ